MDDSNEHQPGIDRRYRLLRTLAGKGSAPDQFAEALRGLAVDVAGRLYAVGDFQVKMFDPDGGVRRSWATARPGYCVAIHPGGWVYVGEPGQVETFDESGTLLDTWEDEEQLGLVTAIGFRGGETLVADAKGRCLRRFDPGRRWINDIGKDNRTKGFLIPNGHLDFCVGADGIIVVLNPGKHRIERYSLTGELLGHFGKFGTKRPEDFGGCCNPTNLTLTREGHAVVTEKAGPRVKVYDSGGTLLGLIDGDAFDANCKNMDVAADARDRLYVADTVRLTILVFAPVTGGT